MVAERRIGLARAISKAGHCSRSEAFTLIRAGKVTLNGRAVRDPEAPTRSADRISIDGQPLAPAARVYLAMNKPRGYEVSTKPSSQRGGTAADSAYALLPPELPFISAVGRLDKASEGLLLFTNDGAWAAAITSPESHLPKTYHVQIDRVPDAALLGQLRRGVRDEGELLRAARVSTLRAGAKNGWLEIVLAEGKNRHIRRMLAALEVETLRLVRVAIGPVELGELKKGETRRLTASEIKQLTAGSGKL